MAYYQNNNRYNKGGYYKKNNNRNNSRPYNYNYNKNFTADNAQKSEYKLDFYKNAQPDILIRDARGTVYTIPAEFSVEFIIYFTENYEKITKINEQIKTEGTNNQTFIELATMLKELILKFINLNVEGVEYTLNDVVRGFGKIDMMMDVFYFIANKMSESLNNSKTVKTLNNK